MRSVSILCIALAAWAVSYGKDAGFEGKWELDKGQSTASSDLPDGLQEQIKAKGGDLVILSRWHEPPNGITPILMLGVMSSEIRLKTDGSQDNAQIGPFNTVNTTSVEGNKMVTKWQAQVNGKQVTGEWTRTLSPDGRNMILDIQQTQEGGQPATAHLVFKKK